MKTPPFLLLALAAVVVPLVSSAADKERFDDGTLGYNYGRFEARGTGPDGKTVVRGGFFLSIWKRQPDGAWKYVMDTGAPERPPAPPPPAPGAPTAAKPLARAAFRSPAFPGGTTNEDAPPQGSFASATFFVCAAR